MVLYSEEAKSAPEADPLDVTYSQAQARRTSPPRQRG